MEVGLYIFVLYFQFLQFAVRLRPAMGRRVEKLLEGYYLACRKSRSSEFTSVPVSALQTL